MATRVQDVCKEEGLSLLDLAHRTGLDLKRLQAIFLGRWTPNPSEREKIATALGRASEDLAWGHETPIQHIYGHGPG